MTPVTAGEPLLTLLTDTPERFDRALAALDGGYRIDPPGTPYDARPLIIDRVG